MKLQPLIRRPRAGHAFHIASKVTGDSSRFRIRECSDMDVACHYDADMLRTGDLTSQSPPQIVRWRDLGRHRLDLRGSLTASNPQVHAFAKNGRTVARFDGTRLLQNTSVPLARVLHGLNGGITAVFRKRESLSGGALVSCKASGTNASMAIYPYLNATQTQVDLGNVSQGGRLTLSQNYSGNWHVETWQRSAGRYTTWRDGLLLTGDTTADSLHPAVTGQGLLIVGYDTTGTPTTGFAGDIAEIIVHRNQVPWSQIPTLHQMLKEKWGIGGNRNRRISLRGTVAQWDACDLLHYADGDAVTAWAAQQGGSNYDFNTVKASGPTFQVMDDGLPGVNFGGGGGLYTSANVDPFASGSAQMVYVVVRPGAQVTTFAPMLSHNVNTAAANFVACVRNGSSANGYFGMYNAPAGSVSTAVTSTAWNGGRMIYIFRRSGTSGLIYMDNFTSGSGTMMASLTTSSQPLYLGVKDNTNDGIVGQICEVILCNVAHDTDEVLANRRILSNKWNCSSQAL